jgi:hypothetical protein
MSGTNFTLTIGYYLWPHFSIYFPLFLCLIDYCACVFLSSTNYTNINLRPTRLLMESSRFCVLDCSSKYGDFKFNSCEFIHCRNSWFLGMIDKHWWTVIGVMPTALILFYDRKLYDYSHLLSLYIYSLYIHLELDSYFMKVRSVSLCLGDWFDIIHNLFCSWSVNDLNWKQFWEEVSFDGERFLFMWLDVCCTNLLNYT